MTRRWWRLIFLQTMCRYIQIMRVPLWTDHCFPHINKDFNDNTLQHLCKKITCDTDDEKELMNEIQLIKQNHQYSQTAIDEYTCDLANYASHHAGSANSSSL